MGSGCRSWRIDIYLYGNKKVTCAVLKDRRLDAEIAPFWYFSGTRFFIYSLFTYLLFIYIFTII